MSNRRKGQGSPPTAKPQSKISKFARGIVDLTYDLARERHRDLSHRGEYTSCEIPSCRGFRDQSVTLYDLIRSFNQMEVSATRAVVADIPLIGHDPVMTRLTNSQQVMTAKVDKSSGERVS